MSNIGVFWEFPLMSQHGLFPGGLGMVRVLVGVPYGLGPIFRLYIFNDIQVQKLGHFSTHPSFPRLKEPHLVRYLKEPLATSTAPLHLVFIFIGSSFRILLPINHHESPPWPPAHRPQQPETRQTIKRYGDLDSDLM